MLEKPLDQVLGVSGRIAATPNKCVKRRPIRFTKNGERFSRRFVGVGLACLQDNGPVRRLERRASLLQSSRDWFRRKFNISGRLLLRGKTEFGKDYVSCLSMPGRHRLIGCGAS